MGVYGIMELHRGLIVKSEHWRQCGLASYFYVIFYLMGSLANIAAKALQLILGLQGVTTFFVTRREILRLTASEMSRDKCEASVLTLLLGLYVIP